MEQKLEQVSTKTCTFKVLLVYEIIRQAFGGNNISCQIDYLHENIRLIFKMCYVREKELFPM
jgi:hypothetical protein